MAPTRPNLLGRRFGKLTVTAEVGFRKSGNQRVSCWKVRCDCGTEKVIVGTNNLRRSRSCGCGRKRPEPPPGKSWCGSCRKFKPLESFYRLRTGPQGRYPQCKKCYRERFDSKREQINGTRREWARRILREAIAAYGGECECCGEDQLEFLAVVRINGGGRKHRRKINTGNMSWWLKKNGYPKGFLVLCHNCNTASRMYGSCPHEHLIVLGR